jgi:phospholipid transport system substrate-binding protein
MLRRRPLFHYPGGFSFALIGWLVFFSPIPAHAAAGRPTDVVQNFYSVLLDVMQHSAALGPKGRYQKLEPVVHGTFDVPFMARLSVGPSWSRLTPEQKRRAAQAYSRYIAAVYASRFDAYAGEQFKVLGEQQIKHGTLIKTQIVKSNGEPVAINYVVHDNDSAWQIRDIYLSGAISELATHRSEFAATLRSSGIDGLIDSLNKKADELQISELRLLRYSCELATGRARWRNGGSNTSAGGKKARV